MSAGVIFGVKVRKGKITAKVAKNIDKIDPRGIFAWGKNGGVNLFSVQRGNMVFRLILKCPLPNGKQSTSIHVSDSRQTDIFFRSNAHLITI
jgi:hypothetical protein